VAKSLLDLIETLERVANGVAVSDTGQARAASQVKIV